MSSESGTSTGTGTKVKHGLLMRLLTAKVFAVTVSGFPLA
jgi:hypothetical protein